MFLKMDPEMLVSRVRRSAKKRTRAIARELCPHCDQNLCMKTFKRHKSLFLRDDGTWIKNATDADNVEDEEAQGMIRI